MTTEISVMYGSEKVNEVADTPFHIQGHKLTLKPGVDTRVNPCAAKVVYVRLQANFRLNKIPPRCVTYLVVDAQLMK